MTENKIGRNDPCPCGSGKKYKKCCIDKKPRENSVIIKSTERLQGLNFDKEKMEFTTGINLKNELTKPDEIYSQTSYIGDKGKEKVISRIQDKVVPNNLELMRYLSSNFDMIVGVDTNTKDIGGEKISATSFVNYLVQPFVKPEKYYVKSLFNVLRLFRNCPSELIPEKYGWMLSAKFTNRAPLNRSKRFALVSDHDMDKHRSYNERKIPILGEFYLPENFTLIYGRGDGSNENLLNSLVRECEKRSNEALKMIKESGYYQKGDRRTSIDQIPIPTL